MISETKKTTAARYGMTIDVDRCNGCGSCMVACAVEVTVDPAVPPGAVQVGGSPGIQDVCGLSSRAKVVSL